MAEPSNPHNVEGENPEQPIVAEEEDEGAAGVGLPALRWTKKTFDNLMLTVQMPPEYGAHYPSEGDTGADAPTGYVTKWADFFGDCNLRLPLTVFVVDVLEWYKVHISQVSPFGMIRIRNFEFTFRALGIEPTVGDFRRFYQMTVSMGFFSFRQRDGTPKLMTPPKGMTMWKKKFFYIKAAAIVADMTFRNVTETIIAETIAVPSSKSVEWFPQLQTIETVKLTNTQLWLLRMMLRMSKNSKPVVRVKSGENAPAWRMFAPDFLGTVETVVCADGEEDHNTIIRSNFRVPTEAALAVELPSGKGDLGALGDPEAKGVPKRQTVKGVRFRQKKIKEVTTVPHLVPQAAGISHSSFRRHKDYVIVSDTLEGLGIAAESRSGAAKKQAEEAVAGGTAAGPPVIGEKRRPEQKAAGGIETKRRRLVTKRSAPTPKKPAVVVEPQDEDFSIFDVPESPRVPRVRVQRRCRRHPLPRWCRSRLFGQRVPQRMWPPRFLIPWIHPTILLTDTEPQSSAAGAKVTGAGAGGAGYDGPPIQHGESELEYYYRTYSQGRSTMYHRPPWTVMQGDDISNDPAACKEILGGLGTPFEIERARAAPRELRINQLSSMLVGTSIVANAILEDYKVLGRREEEAARMRAEAEKLVEAARAGAEQLEKDKAAFEKQKRTSEWAAAAQLKQVRTLAKFLADERKSWNEKMSNERKKWNASWAKQNDILFHARQELTNAKAANATLSQEKAAAEAVSVKALQAKADALKALAEAKEVGARASKALEEAAEKESRASKALEEANAERIRLGKVVESLQAEVQAREVAVTDLTTRVSAAEKRADAAAEAKDALVSSFNQLEADREWLRTHGIARIVEAIMNAPETSSGLDLVKERAREAGFKAGFNRCIGHINVLSAGGYTDQASGFRDVDTEGRLKAAVASFYDTPLACVGELDECLEVADYVDRLRMLYPDVEEEEPAGGAGGDAGTSGTK
uniref:Transposase (putative) gypsy type domain-containing protein n=1 Tax=Helianthus annuus TaxID=4232 RepID=A0A251SLB1_HELAN